MATTLYDTLPGTGVPVTLKTGSLVSYPDVTVVSTFGPVIAPKIQAYDLSSLQLASSGNVAFTLNDRHEMSLSQSNGTVLLESAADPIRVTTSFSPNTFLEAGSNLEVSAASNLVIGVERDGEILHTVGGATAIETGYDENGILRTEILNLQVPNGITPGYAPVGAVNSLWQQVRFSWSSNQGIAVMGGRYDDPITDSGGNVVPRCAAEPVWNFDGGAVGFHFRNPTSGSALRYHWRLNDRDELELVKQRFDAAGSNESAVLAARFGLEDGVPAEFAGAGNVVFREVRSTAGTLVAAVDAFSSGHSPYDLHLAVVPASSARPTGDDFVDPSFANKVVVPGLAPKRTQAVTVGAASYSVQAAAAALAAITQATDVTGAASAPLAVGQSYYLLAMADEPGRPLAGLPATFVFTAS